MLLNEEKEFHRTVNCRPLIDEATKRNWKAGEGRGRGRVSTEN